MAHEKLSEANALFAELRVLPGDPFRDLSTRVRNLLPRPIFQKLDPAAFGFAGVGRDLKILSELPEPDASQGLETWIVAAREQLGRRAKVVDNRLKAADDPGRVTGLASQALSGNERTKFDLIDDLVSNDWVGAADRAVKAVGYIEIPRYFDGALTANDAGTGFLVGPDLVMTAYHVAAARDLPRESHPGQEDFDRQIGEARICFDYLSGDPAGIKPETWIRVKELAWANRALDVAILRLTSAPPDRTPVTFAAGDLPSVDGGLTFVANIVQHPRREYKKIGLRNNAVWKHDDERLYYFTDTRGGSSGAPVFNDAWRMIAVHTGWEQAKNADGKSPIYLNRTQAVVNRGTRSTRILRAFTETSFALPK